MERDDLIVNDQYPLNVLHDEEHGKAVRKDIIKVTVILSLITFVEVMVGVYFGKRAVGADSMAWFGIKMFYIVLTLVKAGYIVLVFMHLGDEKKNLKWVILAPYIGFIVYLIYICLIESAYIFDIFQQFPWLG